VTHFLLLACVEFLAFLLGTLSFRYCAKGHIAKTMLVDTAISLNGFFVIRLVAEAQSSADAFGYVVGAVAGSYLGMRFTRGISDR
jgi:hypothetical protein